MGNNNSQLQESVKAAEISRISRKIGEKKCSFIIFQAETIKAISARNHQGMKGLVPKLTRHIEELNLLKQLDIPNAERERCHTLIYHSEILLVRLRSLLRSVKKNQAQVNTGPDIVVNTTHLDGGHSTHASQDVEEYFKLDTEIIRLHDQLQNTKFSSNEPLNVRKSHLITELKEFQDLLNRKIRDLEEQREIGHQIITLEQLVEGSTETELKELEIRALKIQETIKTSSWDNCFMAKKAELLGRISGILENLHTQNKSQRGLVNNDTDDGEQIYANLAVTNNLHREKHTSMLINKSPLPLPRNPDDIIINSLATQWQRLNEILDKESLNEIDKLEIEKIGQSADLAKKLFENRMAEVVERRLESY